MQLHIFVVKQTSDKANHKTICFFTPELQTAIMNKHLQSLMDGLTAKVFRTYNASRTLQEQLNLLTQGNSG